MYGRMPVAPLRNLLLVVKRGQSNVKVEEISSSPTAAAGSGNHANTKSFEEIPEVKGLPVIGTLLDYTKFRGFKVERIHELWAKRHEEYGDIYKERLMGKNVVVCRSREDTESMFRQEGRMPVRMPNPGLSFVKEVTGMPESFVNLSGDEWYKYRRSVNGPLLMNKMVWKYIQDQAKVAEELTSYVSRHIDEKGEVANFESVLSRWAFEMSATFLLNNRMGLLDDTPDPVVMEMFDGFETMMNFIANAVSSFHLWKYIETKESRELKTGMTRSYEIIADIIEQKVQGGEFDSTVLGKLMKAENLTEDQRKSMVYDILAGSIETTSKAAALIIYCVTRNPDVQEKLCKEIQDLPKNEELTGRILDGMTYMNAFIKESARLYPLVHGHSRAFNKDVVLSGYRIPPETLIMNTSNSTQNRNPDYFPEPDKFLPERWMGDGSQHKYKLTGPFGTAARACPGRRFAMQEIRLLLIELLRNFKVEYHYKPIESIFRATATTSEEPRFTFIPFKKDE